MESNKSKLVTLKLKEDFSNLKKNGNTFRPAKWVLFSYKKNPYTYSRFAWTTPSYLAKAVIRNRLKRWCRVISSEYKDLSNYDINIIFLRQKKDFYKKLNYEIFSSQLKKALQHIQK
ncbi:MAG: ribonuclease P protein component [Bdellovibrionaceae bacterium]|nr:ribonuclease P protein component [Pseudobdellovibrionaceae bacterium]